ncbi:adenosylcobinamide-phosphate synthase CbiB [Prevotella sp. OH937_COT-195]|uniref:adenosylcobinamide-phosphate synthase CbiB n=1 Tax=Prevotella sp. OH937_COT-195 TaxID=2491051 RepID=UPI000F6472B5|nr:adenosylcobinamide-phosphate synthase CbiB [Prevotella sp. OH937_COT-195]RRD00278.1 cobalamin biosynthesis protein CobD [Prevotella sp. OH937_COT-195]
MYSAIALLLGWLADKLLGDPTWLPHPIVLFGKAISIGERRLNKGRHRRAKGVALAVTLIATTFAATYGIIHLLLPIPVARPLPVVGFSVIIIFFCLAGTTLAREVEMVFRAADRSLDAGRRQVGRIVGRDTSCLTDQEVRKASLETLAENLSDGVIAPLFWLGILGLPGMMTYKMINTLDSMIGYRTERYRLFGTAAAVIDDVANYLPARITALLMIFVAGRPSLLRFVWRYGSRHASPNSGWPEAALAGILNCRFGGTHTYFGETIEKPYIGEHERRLTSADMHRAIRINRRVEAVAIIVMALIAAVLNC